MSTAKLGILVLFAIFFGMASAQSVYPMARSNYTQGNMSTTLHLISEGYTSVTIQLYINGGIPPYNVNLTALDEGTGTYDYLNITNVTANNAYYNYTIHLNSGIYNITANVISGAAKMQSFSTLTLNEKQNITIITNPNSTTSSTSTVYTTTVEMTNSTTSQSSTTSQNTTSTTSIEQSNNGGGIFGFFSGIINAILKFFHI